MSSGPVGRTAKLILALMAGSLTACSGLVKPQTDSVHKVEVDGLNYRVEQITASTWTATPASVLSGPSPKADSLVLAVEKASGCKVTDSSFSHKGAALSAQVTCASKLKN